MCRTPWWLLAQALEGEMQRRSSLGFLMLSIVIEGSTSGGLRGQETDVTSVEFAKALSSPDSLLRHNTWKRLNAEDRTQFGWLKRILKQQPWYDRDGAAIALAKAATDKTIKKMLTALKREPNPFVRQGMAVALAKMNDPAHYPNLYAALDDKHPFVRRVVVHSLRVHKRPEAVTALIDRFRQESDPVVKTFIQDSLNELTQAYRGTDPRAWQAWWQEAQKDKDYKLGETDKEAKKAAERLGKKLRERRTLSAALTLVTSERGRYDPDQGGVPILVLPQYGHSKETMLPFLAELEQVNKLYYIDLPEIDSFQNLATVGRTGLPHYPIDELVDAFEDLRKETRQERFAILACGMNSWVAMRYASKNPESVSHMILVAPLSSRQAYGNATQRMTGEGQKRNDVELWHLGLGRRVNTETGVSHHDEYHNEKGIPKPNGEDAGIDRRGWSLWFANPQDSLLSVLYPIAHRPMGGVMIPDFKCFQEPRRNIKTLVIVGKHSMYASVKDCEQIAKHYGGRPPLVYPASACMPFAEEGPRFNRDVSRFLGNKLKKKKKKAPRRQSEKKKKRTKKKSPPKEPAC